VHFSRGSLEALHWRANHLGRWNGSCWEPTKQLHEIIVIMDASPYGWGAILQVLAKNQKLSGFLSSLEGLRWQNEREAIAVHQALKSF
jgi:hypothetical protein